MSLIETARAHLDAYETLRRDNTLKDEQIESLDRAYASVKSENDLLRHQLQSAQFSRDTYMRFCVEMVTQMNNVGALVNDCVAKAQAAAREHLQGPNGRTDPNTPDDQLPYRAEPVDALAPPQPPTSRNTEPEQSNRPAPLDGFAPRLRGHVPDARPLPAFLAQGPRQPDE